MKKEIITLLLAISVPIAFILGERSICISFNGKYNWDYGTCQVEK